jgi:carbonic anhydrase/acetyltransferase-like protein (isoleucine patch superfamily)
MGATLLDGVVMEPGSIVAAGAVVPPGEKITCCVVHCPACFYVMDAMQPSVFVVIGLASQAALWQQSQLWCQTAQARHMFGQQTLQQEVWVPGRLLCKHT